MAIKIDVTAPHDIVDPYSAFKNKEQKALLEEFKNGATLCVWRCSTPHNWYLETKSGMEIPIESDGYVMAALRRLARQSYISSRLVTRGHRFENGQPEKQCWTFDPAVASVLEARWAEFDAELQARAAKTRHPAPAFDKLSSMAISLLRTLRAGACLRRFPELHKEFAELDNQGLLELTVYGKYRLAPEVSRLRIPRGQSLCLS